MPSKRREFLEKSIHYLNVSAQLAKKHQHADVYQILTEAITKIQALLDKAD